MDAAKRECILESAVKAFTKHGFKKAAIEDIARAAGVAKGTVYLTCESKEDLFYQAVHRELRGWVAEVSTMIDPRVHADELLQRVSVHGLTIMERRPLVRDLFMGIYHGQLPGWADRFDELKSLGRANGIEILRLGQRQGRFRADLDVDAVAWVLQELQLATILDHVQRASGPAGPELVRRAQAAFDMVMHGLATPAARTTA